MRNENKDQSIFNMLKSERDRCVFVAERINKELDKLPKGSIGARKVKSHGKEYVYPCLRYRQGKKVVFKHLSIEKVEELRPILERRKNLGADLKANKRRIATLDALLKKV